MARQYDHPLRDNVTSFAAPVRTFPDPEAAKANVAEAASDFARKCDGDPEVSEPEIEGLFDDGGMAVVDVEFTSA